MKPDYQVTDEMAQQLAAILDTLQDMARDTTLEEEREAALLDAVRLVRAAFEAVEGLGA